MNVTWDEFLFPVVGLIIIIVIRIWVVSKRPQNCPYYRKSIVGGSCVIAPYPNFCEMESRGGDVFADCQLFQQAQADAVKTIYAIQIHDSLVPAQAIPPIKTQPKLSSHQGKMSMKKKALGIGGLSDWQPDQMKKIIQFTLELLRIGPMTTDDPYYGRTGYYSTFFSTNKNRTRQIGYKLNRIGGIDAMREAGEAVHRQMGAGAARELEVCWGGIGEWQA